jgi:putative spermidine/putrescine transport system ATP-binding protein
MRAGEVRQVGTPEELYGRPAHADVAEFMGYRNQLRVTAARTGTGVTIRVGNVTLTGTAVEPFVEGEAVAAIRPEDLGVSANGAIEATGESSQYHGDCFYSSGRTTDGADLFFRSDRRLNKGETVRLAADPARVLVYSGGRP